MLPLLVRDVSQSSVEVDHRTFELQFVIIAHGHSVGPSGDD